ncbi:methyltransferase domain-containing protein [Paracoccus sp. S-4012]|uniref:SAM-dependent methyltransferase n=1 Tax=Paracoccus sp. S-4012 TaxID=2665648 RepID=UPI0012B09CB8|nr:cyclopropane-fatty-acyl-phospholipid synthase family protein [Paracoccus sp. S-4012]MRX49347.1 methyltransferase domain-containing protein [Paracoccus sp. S-4012]
MLDRILDTLLRSVLRRGELTVTYPDGRTRRYGPGPEAPAPAGSSRAVTPPAPAVAIRIHDRPTMRAILRDPDMGVGEAYMDGRLTIEGDDLAGFLTLALANRAVEPRGWALWRLTPVRNAMRPFTEWNRAARARRNVAHHYDLSGELYELFLDRDRQYSCAYWPRADMTLDEAQEAKKHHIARKLRIEPGMRVLDIGCGWGGMALTLARDYGARVTGVTLSQEQLAWARRRIEAEGMADRIDLQLLDYRAVQGQFDRIVSVGMFEHVGTPHYRQFFRTVRERLTDDGVALLHTIGSSGPPAPTSSFIRKYIFPGGALPSLSQIATACERERVTITDVEVWRRHYAETLAEWRARFEARAAEAEALYDERFVRMWRYYLLGPEMAFRLHRLVVFQVQLARRNDSLPITRNYMMDPPEDQNGRTTLPE